MPSWFDRFTKIWASAGLLNDPTDAQANAGWSFIGQAPPTVEQFNSTHQWWDQKDNWLFGQINEVIKQAAMVSADTPLTTLRDAILSFNRKYLTGPMTVYIDVLNGDDTLNDGSNAKPWKTIQHAIDYLYRNIDGGGQNIYIQLKVAGTYAQFTVRGFFNGVINIVGDVLNYRSYIIKNTAGPAVVTDQSAIIILSGISVEGTGSQVDYSPWPGGVVVQRSSIVFYDRIAFGPCTIAHVYSNGGGVFWPIYGASGQYHIYGGAQIHLAADTSGNVTVVSVTATVDNAVTFSVSLLQIAAGAVCNCWNWNIVNKGNITTPLSWNAFAFGSIATKNNLTIFPTATGYPPTIGTMPTSGNGVGGIIT